MHEDLMQWLRCPVCRGPLTLSVYEACESSREILSGLLVCSCKAKFPIWRGVPRMLLPGTGGISREFVSQFRDRLSQDASELVSEAGSAESSRNYSFDQEWCMYRYGELTWELDLPTRVTYVYHYLQAAPGALNGALVLDAGCGNGTLSAGLAASGPRVVALDYSESVERAERERQRFAGAAADRLDYVQGDLQHPPFAPGAFDAVYSDGVLHHTPNTRGSLAAITPLVKQGGKLFVWLYRSDLRPVYRAKMATIRILRAVMRPLPKQMVKGLCYFGASVLLAQLRIQHLLGIKKRRIIPLWLKAVNLFDTFTPRYNHVQAPGEVISWFREEGFSQVVETTIPSLGHGGFGMLGIR
jgi:2-polyprenyl-3-methyl-5-hydroxy-6-metoxy-1,4-benzoquinol methylase/uncharacterized protein YbaR (Trm112 family)